MSSTARLAGFWNNYKLQFSILVIYVALLLIFYGLNMSAFTDPYTYYAMMSVMPFTIIPALSLTYVMICGEIDLSFPAMMALGSVVFAATWNATGLGALGICIGILAGATAGFVNGLLVARARIPSIIATLGTMFLWRGVVLVATEGSPISLFKYKDTFLFDVLVGKIAEVIPAQMIWATGIGVCAWIFLNMHRFGSQVFFTGDNRIAARMMGIDTDKVLITVFVVHGAVAAFAGILASVQVANAWPTLGDAYLMKSIASVVIGGTSIFGGAGTLFGTYLGGMVLGLVEIGLLASGVSGYWISLVYGLVITLALMVQTQIRTIELKREKLAKMTR